MPKWREVITVEPVMFLFAFANGFSIIGNQVMLYEKVCRNMYPVDICDNLTADANEEYLTKVQQRTAKWFSYQNIMYSIPVLVTLALYGSWSDKFSRKIPMLLVPIATLLATTNDLINAIYIDADPAYLLIGYFIYGVTGGFTTLNLVVFSYMSEATKNEARTTRLSIISAFPNLAYIVSTVTVGLTLDSFGYIPVYAVAMSCHFLTILYISFWIKDIKPEDRKVDEDGAKTEDVSFSQLTAKGKCLAVFNFSHFKDSVLVMFEKRGGSIRLCIILAVLVATTNTVTSALGTFYLYFNYPPLSLGDTLYGYYNAWGAIIYGSSQLLAIPLLKSKFHVRDSVLAVAGNASDLLSRIWFGVCRQNWMLFVVPFTAYMWPAVTVSVRSILATLVRPEEFGKISAVLAWVDSLCVLFATFLFANVLYPATVDTYSGIVYFISAVLCIIPLSLAIWLMRLLRDETAVIITPEEDVEVVDWTQDTGPANDVHPY